MNPDAIDRLRDEKKEELIQSPEVQLEILAKQMIQANKSILEDYQNNLILLSKALKGMNDSYENLQAVTRAIGELKQLVWNVTRKE